MDCVYKNIKLIRLKRKLKQKELADLLGFCRSYMSMIESGQRDISISLLRQIAEALKVAPQALLEDEPKNVNIHSIEWLEEYSRQLDDYRDSLQFRQDELDRLIEKMRNKLGN